MVRPLSLDLRERVVAAVAKGESCRSVAARFEVSVSSVVKWSQRARRRATSGRSCSAACRLFFEGEAFAAAEIPYREIAGLDPLIGQRRDERPQSDVRLARELRQDDVAMAR